MSYSYNSYSYFDTPDASPRDKPKKLIKYNPYDLWNYLRDNFFFEGIWGCHPVKKLICPMCAKEHKRFIYRKYSSAKIANYIFEIVINYQKSLDHTYAEVNSVTNKNYLLTGIMTCSGFCGLKCFKDWALRSKLDEYLIENQGDIVIDVLNRNTIVERIKASYEFK